MESEGSLQCSQKPTTSPYHKPDESSPHHLIFLRLILILSSYLCPGLPSVSLPSGLPTKILHAFNISPYLLHSLRISYREIKYYVLRDIYVSLLFGQRTAVMPE
jgi:hypothetical protein